MDQAHTLPQTLTRDRRAQGARHGLRSVLGAAWGQLPAAVRERFADTAGTVTYAGFCNKNTLTWCKNNVLTTADCAATGRVCNFIDGPTGYTYVWVADQGWKFVGKVTQRIR